MSKGELIVCLEDAKGIDNAPVCRVLESATIFWISHFRADIPRIEE